MPQQSRQKDPPPPQPTTKARPTHLGFIIFSATAVCTRRVECGAGGGVW